MLGGMGPDHSSTSLFTTEPPSCNATGQHSDGGIHTAAYTPMAGLLIHAHTACTFWQHAAHHTDTGGAAVHGTENSKHV